MAEIVTVMISLKEAGLTHAKGKSDKCGGDHEVVIDLDVEDGLHTEGSCLTEEMLASVQKLHELAHPRGTVSVLYCLERECSGLLDQLGTAD